MNLPLANGWYSLESFPWYLVRVNDMKLRISVLENKAGEPLTIDFEVPDDLLSQMELHQQPWLILHEIRYKGKELVDYMYPPEKLREDGL